MLAGGASGREQAAPADLRSSLSEGMAMTGSPPCNGAIRCGQRPWDGRWDRRARRFTGTCGGQLDYALDHQYARARSGNGSQGELFEDTGSSAP